MIRAHKTRILIFGAIGIVVVVLGYFTIVQLKFETKLDDLKKFCGSLKLQTSVDEVRDSTALASGLQMTLLESTPDGTQLGSIYFEGVGQGGCSISFMRGRLTQRIFFYGAKDPTKPGERLKSW
ncbi:hypothetical protein BH10BDE1_BH10BDE1_33210 [soil metagenome]